ncbi:unnamed protein product [Wickerhamomyces anomalus]
MNFNPRDIEQLVPRVFPTSINNGKCQLNCNINPSTIELESNYLPLISQNLSHFYIEINGNDWSSAKLQEMQEEGLIYVSYHVRSNATEADSENLPIIGFISFVDTLDDEGRVLYLYEIHIHPDHQGEGVGRVLINGFHQLAKQLPKRNGEQIDGYAQERGQVLKGTKLTVFSANDVLNWYFKLGYQLSEDSPRDRKLRNGRVIQPDYYLLYREILN